MTRLPDWERRLSAFVTDNRTRPFEWGHWDCVMMACAAVEAITGTDPVKGLRGGYSDAEGAARFLREHGSGTLVRTFNDRFERRPPWKVRRGDLVMVGKSIGICFGPYALFVGEAEGQGGAIIGQGLVPVRLASITRAWTV